MRPYASTTPFGLKRTSCFPWWFFPALLGLEDGVLSQAGQPAERKPIRVHLGFPSAASVPLWLTLWLRPSGRARHPVVNQNSDSLTCPIHPLRPSHPSLIARPVPYFNSPLVDPGARQKERNLYRRRAGSVLLRGVGIAIGIASPLRSRFRYRSRWVRESFHSHALSAMIPSRAGLEALDPGGRRNCRLNPRPSRRIHRCPIPPSLIRTCTSGTRVD